MKRKYFAYLHENNHWCIKHWGNKKRFMEIVEDGLCNNSFVKAVFMPFEIDKPLEDWEKELQEKGSICLAKIPIGSVKDSPALLHIKKLVGQIDWTKG